LAFRMQTALPEVLDIANESAATKAMYGIGEQATDNFGRQCLLARRFVEAGVRFVELTSGQWDHHQNLKTALGNKAQSIDKPIAGLLRDLKARGLLKDTLVLWGGEFGRTPYAQGTDGRDHNSKALPRGWPVPAQRVASPMEPPTTMATRPSRGRFTS